MPNLISAPTSSHRCWAFDSRRWLGYQPRRDDIIIATNPKCGTTWTQRIVSMLVLQTTAPRPLFEVSVWIDARMFQPLEDALATLDGQTHRRFIKTHLPLDALPFYDDVRYIHVARDGRDAFMSYHNHRHSFTEGALQRFDGIGMADAALGRVYPRCPDDPRAWFRDWLHGRVDAGTEHDPQKSNFFHTEASYWAERHRPNMLMVHYNDLKADLDGEMRRIAEFLEIETPPDLWKEMVAAADFSAMRRDSTSLLPAMTRTFNGGPQQFIYRGTNGRWRDVLSEDDLAAYDARVAETLPPACARWLETGRLVAGDPRAL